MIFAIAASSTGRFRQILRAVLQPRQAPVATEQKIGESIRRALVVVLSALMILVPMDQGVAFAQAPPNSPQGQQAPQVQPLPPDQLNQLVAPIALYPDALVAQVLAASTYPGQAADADRWRQAQGNATPDQVAAAANAQNWDPSVKALTAFPSVLSQMDHSYQWTVDLGNAYYNQPQDVMTAVQVMRQRAEAAGQLRSTPQQNVSSDAGIIVIAPANPVLVYAPVYNPWVVYGVPVVAYPGFYYVPPPGVVWGGLAIGFAVGVGIAAFATWGWGWGHWGVGWSDRTVVYNNTTYISRSTTVVNRGFNRPGGPGGGVRGAANGRAGDYGRSAGDNRGGVRAGASNGRAPARASGPGGAGNRSAPAARGAYGANRGPSSGRPAAATHDATRPSAARSASPGRTTASARAGSSNATRPNSAARTSNAPHAMASRAGGASGGRASAPRSSGGHPAAAARPSGGGGRPAAGGGRRRP